MSTIRAAVDLKQTFDQIAAAEKAGNLSAEEKKKLEEAAAEKACITSSMSFSSFLLSINNIVIGYPNTFQGNTTSLWRLPSLTCYVQGTKLEIESVLREVCDRVLSPDPQPRRQSNEPYPVSPASVSLEKLHFRAFALQIMGEVRI